MKVREPKGLRQNLINDLVFMSVGITLGLVFMWNWHLNYVDELRSGKTALAPAICQGELKTENITVATQQFCIDGTYTINFGDLPCKEIRKNCFYCEWKAQRTICIE